MPILSKPSSAARTSVIYITTGALMIVWTAIWYLWLRHRDPGQESAQYYWCLGFFLSGVVILAIGFALGRIGRAARHAELPPDAPNSPTAEPAVTADVPANRSAGATNGSAVAVTGYPATGQVVVPAASNAGTAPVAPPAPAAQSPVTRRG